MTNFVSIDPRDTDVVNWSQQMAINLDQFGPVMRLMDENGWKDWGLSVMSLISQNGATVPDPTFFEDWRPWASQLNEVLETL